MKIKALLLVKLVLIVMIGVNAQSTANDFPASGNASLGTSNYLVNGRMHYQAYTVTNNIYNRGSIANNLYWDNANNVWTTSNSTNSDFGMVRFENGGLISFFSGNSTGSAQTFSNDDIEAFRRVTIRNEGYIGIGTKNPDTYLSITQSTSSGNYGGYPAIEVNNPNTTGNAVSALVLRSGTVSAAGLVGAIGGLQCKSIDNATQLTWLRSYAAAYPIYIGYNQTDLAVNNGKVGIGTTNPVEKLSVEGTILAKKVKVSQASADWPDYVFNEDYPLMPLDSVEAFIQANGHLPEIASADEVLNDGIDLGDNQTKLLQKTEELTLYLIGQDKKIKQLTEQNKQLNQQISQIDEMKILIDRLQKTIEQLQDTRQSTQTNKN